MYAEQSLFFVAYIALHEQYMIGLLLYTSWRNLFFFFLDNVELLNRRDT